MWVDTRKLTAGQELNCQQSLGQIFQLNLLTTQPYNIREDKQILPVPMISKHFPKDSVVVCRRGVLSLSVNQAVRLAPRKMERKHVSLAYKSRLIKTPVCLSVCRSPTHNFRTLIFMKFGRPVMSFKGPSMR
jgi:hypothetical protein